MRDSIKDVVTTQGEINLSSIHGAPELVLEEGKIDEPYEPEFVNMATKMN